MDKNLKMSLSIVLGGYISSLAFYFIWYFHFFYEWLYGDDYFLEIAAVVSAITAVYFIPLLLILYIKSLQKVWTSLSLVSIITLLIFFLIPSAYYAEYYKSYVAKLNLKREQTIKIIDENEPERKVLAANKKEIQKQLVDAKEKIQTEHKGTEEIEPKLKSEIAKNDATKQLITELQTKLESERKKNDKLSKQLNEIIRETISLEEGHKTKEDVIIQTKSNKDFSKIKINSEMVKNDSDTINQEIIFKVQIISLGTRLATNALQLRGQKMYGNIKKAVYTNIL